LDWDHVVTSAADLVAALQNAAYRSVFVPSGTYNVGETDIVQATGQLVLCEAGVTVNFGVMAQHYFGVASGSMIHNLNLTGWQASAGLWQLGDGYNRWLYGCSATPNTGSGIGFGGTFRISGPLNAAHYGGLFGCTVTLGVAASVGYYGLQGLVNCAAIVNAAGCEAYNNCCRMNNCNAYDSIGSKTGYYECHELVSCLARGFGVGGFASSAGFYLCVAVSGSAATSGYGGAGFKSCRDLAACVANTNTNLGSGFVTCQMLSACDADINAGDGYNNCTGIAASEANSNTGWGFNTCLNLSSTISSANTAGAYNGAAGTHCAQSVT
jgi:hypothetical protein